MGNERPVLTARFYGILFIVGVDMALWRKA